MHRSSMTSVLCVLFAVAMGVCTAPKRQEETTVQAPDIAAADQGQFIDNAHSSRNALDWSGVYRGVLPCADCAGIETTVTLMKNGRFIRTTQYLGRDEQIFTEEGAFTWNDAGSTVRLKFGDGPEQQYKVGEHVLFHLDRDGKMITGALSDKYRLIKSRTDARIEGIPWILAELMGHAVDDPDRQGSAFFILERDFGRIRGNNSCNVFTGSYELPEPDGIRMGDIAGTLMACPDMELADTFMLMLEQVRRYSVRDSVLSLFDAAGEPLADFRAGID